MAHVFPPTWTQQQISSYVPEPLDPELYDVNCTLGDVRQYLSEVKTCIREDRFIVEAGDPTDPDNTRNKNDDFLAVYGLSNDDVKDILLSLDETEFCHVRLTNDDRRLYVFCRKTRLYRIAKGHEPVAIYIKHDYDGAGFDVVISFHALERPIEVPFAD